MKYVLLAFLAMGCTSLIAQDAPDSTPMKFDLKAAQEGVQRNAEAIKKLEDKVNSIALMTLPDEVLDAEKKNLGSEAAEPGAGDKLRKGLETLKDLTPEVEGGLEIPDTRGPDCGVGDTLTESAAECENPLCKCVDCKCDPCTCGSEQLQLGTSSAADDTVEGEVLRGGFGQATQFVGYTQAAPTFVQNSAPVRSGNSQGNTQAPPLGTGYNPNVGNGNCQGNPRTSYAPKALGYVVQNVAPPAPAPVVRYEYVQAPPPPAPAPVVRYEYVQAPRVQTQTVAPVVPEVRYDYQPRLSAPASRPAAASNQGNTRTRRTPFRTSVSNLLGAGNVGGVTGPLQNVFTRPTACSLNPDGTVSCN